MGNRGIKRNARAARRTTAEQPVTPLQQQVLDMLTGTPQRVGDLARMVGRHTSSVRGALMSLEEKGRARRAPRQQGWTST